MQETSLPHRQTEGLPIVTIVTPSFNQVRYLEQAMVSVLEQDYPAIEYIVIDGGSTDGSLAVIQRYADRLAHWRSGPDQGQTEALNKGFSLGKGEIYAWLNSDDRLVAGAVRRAVGFLRDHPEIGMVYGDADYIDEDGQVLGRFPAAQTDYTRLRRGYVHIPQQATFFRSKLWRMVGSLDPSFYFAMDYDLWVRIAAVTPIHYHPEMWGQFRLHSEAKTLAAAERCWPEMLRVHRRLGGGLLSILGFKYLLRRILEPILPWRLHARLWLQQWAMARE